ncbi:MAG TPA: hypothetical protein DCM08_11885 [Microscillaceae bacterium]|jgi:hypothetical protein|nr:hypothetical protein [Microscillaceae bacterium]
MKKIILGSLIAVTAFSFTACNWFSTPENKNPDASVEKNDGKKVEASGETDPQKSVEQTQDKAEGDKTKTTEKTDNPVKKEGDASKQEVKKEAKEEKKEVKK